jgi:uncharacterized protein YkwD
MKKAFFILVIAAGAVALGMVIWQIWPWNKMRLPTFDKVSAELLELSKKVAAPGPLVVEKKNPEAYLTRQGVFDWTNYYRKQEGLSALTFNNKLNSAAEAKLADMFTNQYFEHVSPAGYGPAHWVEATGYAYIIIGENLAMGDFQNDKALVDGWMASPGHRANIMNAKYQEIGVAVGRKNYEGRLTWMAVQEFGAPLSACPAIDESLKDKIAQYESQISVLETQITNLSAELETTKKHLKTQEAVDAYNRKADEYNALLLEYQSLSGGIKDFVKQYNNQVNIFNDCAGG